MNEDVIPDSRFEIGESATVLNGRYQNEMCVIKEKDYRINKRTNKSYYIYAVEVPSFFMRVYFRESELEKLPNTVKYIMD